MSEMGTVVRCEVKDCIANKEGLCQGEEIFIDTTACCEQLEYEEEDEEDEPSFIAEIH